MSSQVRARGLFVFSGGAIATVLIAFGLQSGSLVIGGGWFSLAAMVLYATPGAIALAGLIQFATGVPFNKLAAEWNSLCGWQRGLVGLLVIAVALATFLPVGFFLVSCC